MTKPKRRNKNSRARPSIEPVEGFEVAGVSFVRDGKDIYVSNHRTAEDHEQFLADVREKVLPQVRAKREQLRQRLDMILDQADAIDLLARAGLEYLPIDPDTYKEWESDRSTAHIEYLAMQALPRSLDEPQELDPLLSEALTTEAIQIARDLFEAEAQLVMLTRAEQPESVSDQTQQYRDRTRLESMSVRGSAYAEHSRAVLLGTLGRTDADCARLLHFTAKQALEITTAILDVTNARLGPRVEEALDARKDMLRQLPRQRRKGVDGPVPDWIVAMKPSESRKWVDIITRVWIYSEARQLATVTAIEIADASGVTEPSVAAFLDAFSCPASAYNENHHRFPVGAHPLTSTPIIQVRGGYILPVASSMLEALRPRMEDLLQQAEDGAWTRYLKRRAEFVEEEAVRRLSDALPGATGSTGLKWKSTSDESDLDGLVAVDDFSLRIQAKAGRMHAATRRGAPDRMKKNLAELIKEASRQHSALGTALASESASSIGLGKYRTALEEAPFQIEVIICLDDVTVWSTQSQKLREIDVLPSDRPIPWILSLTDLMAVTDLLDGAQLLLYIIRRLRLEAIGKLVAHDELDWVGHFIDQGLYFEDIFNGPNAPDEYRLTTFTEQIDSWYFTRDGSRTTPAPKPRQPVPPRLGALLRRLENERPAHWTIASMSLLMGNDESRQLWDEAIVRAGQRQFTTGWSNTTQVFGSVAVTYLMDLRNAGRQFASQLEAYIDQKMEQPGTNNWVALGDAGRGPLVVIVRSADPEGIKRLFSESSTSS